MNTSLFQVNLSGILKILSDSLYSQKEVFLRELLQNAIDAIQARKYLNAAFEPKIRVDFFDTDTGKALVINDNGVGLTKSEVEEFLSKVGASSKSKEALEDIRAEFIGQFGIGLLSCFMVSDEIVVHSRSAKADYTVRWVGNIDGTYQTSVVEGEEAEQEIGTRVVLKLRSDIQLDRQKLLELLDLYGAYLDVPVEVEANGRFVKTLQTQFPWENTRFSDSALQLGRKLFRENFSSYIPLTDRSNQTKGIAYILPRPTQYQAAAQNRVYIKRMFITEEESNILPEWAFFVKAIINSDNLAPTASRESLYKNDTLQTVREDLGHCIKDYLKQLSIDSPETLEQIIKVHGYALKSLCLKDADFLGFIADWFTFPTTMGELTLAQIKERTDSVFYVPDIDEFRQIIPVARANNQLVINAGYVYDADLLHAIGDLDAARLYQRIDTEYFGNFLNDISIENHDLFRNRLDRLQIHLNAFKCELDIKQFAPENIPAIFYMSEKKLIERDVTKIKEESNDLWAGISNMVFQSVGGFQSKLYLNFNNPIVRKLLHADS
ncbi:MAG: HSP90 family protein, partial [Chitinophagales bacterium]